MTQINLPDGKTWSFSYYHQPSPGMPSTLLLAQVNYPMGGYSRYNYGNNNQMSAGLTQRIVNANNGQGEITTNYAGTGCATTCYVTVTAPDASYVVYLFDSGGRKSTRIYYDASNRALKKTFTGMSTDCNGLARQSSVLTYVNIAVPGATPSWQQVSTDSRTQDCVGNVTQEESTAVTPSSNFKGRRTTRVFLSLANYIYRVQQEIAYDLDSALNTTLVSRTDYAYDQFALTARSEAGGIPGHDDANYGTGYTTRGNLTTASGWLASESRSIIKTSYYDILGNVVQQTDAKNYSTTINYSQTFHFAYPTQVINPKGHTVNTNYSFYTGQISTATNANNFTTTTTYDSLNRVSRIDNPDGSYIRATYDLTANNFSTTVYKSVAAGQESSTTTYLDGIGREKQKRTSDPAGDIYVDTQYYVCDCNGKTSKVSNPYRLGETVYLTETQYDALGRPTKIIPPDGSSSSNYTRYDYYDGSDMTSVLVTDPTGKQRKYDRDVIGRTSKVIPGSSWPAPYSGTMAHHSAIFAGAHQHYFWGASSPIPVDTGAWLVAWVYLDPLNPPSEIMLQWNDGTWEHRAYWGADNIPWGTNGSASRWYMGPLPVVAKWVQLAVPASSVGLEGRSVNGMAFTLFGGRASFDYATVAGVLWVEDSVPAGATTAADSETWDWRGAPDEAVYNYLPTLGQNKLVITQGVQTRTFNYDTLGRLTSETHPENGTTSYAYDDSGNVTAKTDARGWVTNYTYDQLNRSTGKTYLNDGGVTPAATLTYDTASNGVGQLATWATGSHSGSKTYDSMGRTVTETRNISASSYTAQWSYNLAGEVLTTTYPNGWTTTNGYDGVGNLASIGSSFAGTIVSSATRNAAGQFTQINYGNGVTNSRSYNNDLQLSNITISGPGGTYFNQTYGYNAGVANNSRVASITNNLDSTTSISYSYDALNRLLSAATSGPQWGLSWTYDRYGNRLSQTVTKGSAPSNSLSVDVNSNRVTGWTYDAAGNVTNDGRNTYAYDAENRVISINAGATSYSYDAFGSRVTKTTGSTIVRYYFGLAENTNGTWTKILVATAAGVIEWDNGTMLYKSNDHLGTARVVTNSSGTVIGQTNLYPYGEIWSDTGTTSKYKFTGKERDTESGNDYFGARYYWNGAGRWLNVDPVVNDISDPQRLNRYSYCLNDPINYIDPDGADPIILAPGSLGGAIVIAFLPQVPDAAAAFIIQSILKNLPSASSLGVGQQTAYYNIPSPGSNVWIGLTAFGAAKRAADRIDKDCSNFFSAANASGAGLRSMLDKGKILYKDLGVPQGTPKSYTYTVAQQDSGSIFINSQGPFDNPTATKLGSGDIQNILADFNRSHQTDLTETQFQELFLIHEYAHTFGTTLLENDRKADGTIDIDASQRNTQKVLDNCFKK